MSQEVQRVECYFSVPRLETMLSDAGLGREQVIVSRDFTEDMMAKFSAHSLAEDGFIDPEFSEHIPDGSGLRKWALPFIFGNAGGIFMVHVPAKTSVPIHSHEKGFLRQIFKGEITFHGIPNSPVTLGPGDWIYIPPGQTYGYETGIAPLDMNCCYCRF